jgi:hypothetical protein
VQDIRKVGKIINWCDLEPLEYLRPSERKMKRSCKNYKIAIIAACQFPAIFNAAGLLCDELPACKQWPAITDRVSNPMDWFAQRFVDRTITVSECSWTVTAPGVKPEQAGLTRFARQPQIENYNPTFSVTMPGKIHTDLGA